MVNNNALSGKPQAPAGRTDKRKRIWYTDDKMSLRQMYTTKQLIKRSLLPSGMSFLLCLVLGFGLVAINIVLLSVDVGTSLPGILDGQWAIAYTQHVVQPLTTFLSNNTFNKLLVALLWGLAGFTMYVGFEYVMHWKKTLRDTQHDVQMARGAIVEHPMQDEFWKMVRWRVIVIACTLVFIVIMQPLLSHAMKVAPEFVVSKDLVNDGVMAGIAMLEWAIFFHGMVVALRLYTMRTRMFGDDLLY